MKDATGRWSNWSSPVEFTAGPPLVPFPQQTHLRVTEIMYHPEGGLGHEFIEVQNTGLDPLDLRPVSLGGGVRFRFEQSEIEELGPGEYAVVVEDRRVFDLAYGAGLPVAGEYSGRLENAGEQIVHGGNATILDFTYVDEWYPLTDGGGRSLVVADPLQPIEAWGTQGGWQESAADGGSPGGPDGSGPPAGGLQRPGDSNQDGTLDLSDGISFLLRLSGGGGGGGPLPCDGGSIGEGGNALLFDLNGDARADLSDAIFVLNYLFRGGAAPALGTSCVRLAGCPHACGF